MDSEVWRSIIRDVPGFPKPDIVFKDITTLLKDGKAFGSVVDTLAARYGECGVSEVVCVEARGFVLGAALAYKLGAGVVPVRKKGKLPAKTYSETYELEYGTDTLEIHCDALAGGGRVLIVDDLLATGGTALATARLVKDAGGQIVEIAFLIELTFLNGREKLGEYPVFSLIIY